MTHAEPVTVSVNRYGYKIRGESFDRVTTRLRGIPKPWLGGWAAKQVAAYAIENLSILSDLVGENPDEALPYLLTNERMPDSIEDRDTIKAAYDMLKGSPWKKRDDAADRGTAVHEAIHAYLEDRPLPDSLVDEDQLACAIAVETFLNERKPKVLGAEVTVCSPSLGYAGTLDFWCMMDGEEWIIDWKTSKDIYTEHAVQQVAYKHADLAIVEKVQIGKDKWTGRAIEWSPPGVGSSRPVRLGIAHVTPDGVTLYPIRQEAQKRLWTVFRAASHVKQFLADTDSYRGTPRFEVFDTPVTTNAEVTA